MNYEISIDRVVDMFSTLAGEVNAAESALFCRSAADTVAGWLDKSKDLSGNDYKISYAAAVMAYYRYCLKSTGESVDFKAGDITVREHKDERLRVAEQLLKDAIHSIETLFYNKRFAFMSVLGKAE
ncbi:MAG: hypothetical protein E7525_07265 [Ruminococcaceae bacterium]|nr:hypothetical protein [Oscillospiraceae bacterium]